MAMLRVSFIPAHLPEPASALSGWAGCEQSDVESHVKSLRKTKVLLLPKSIVLLNKFLI